MRSFLWAISYRLLENCKDYNAKSAFLALVDTDRFRQLTESTFVGQDIEYMK